MYERVISTVTTIGERADIQCPWCSRGRKTLECRGFSYERKLLGGMSAVLGSASDFCIPSIDAMERQGRPLNSRELLHRALSMDGDHDDPFVLLQPGGRSKDVEPSVGAERGSRVQIIPSPLAVEQASKKESATKSCSVGET
jgi:hypothetical protein